MTPGALLTLGQVLGISVASGLNLYATVFALGIASRLAWIPPLPPGLRGLESGVILLAAALLFLVEAVLDKVAATEWLWDTLHTLIRPLGAGLLAFGIVGGHALGPRLGAALLAAAVALALHGSKAGVRVTLRATAGGSGCRRISAAEDTLALLLGFFVLGRPAVALAVAGAAIMIVFLWGRRFWRAALLGLRALIARMRRFFMGGDWVALGAVPGRLRAAVGEPAPGESVPRVARVAVAGLAGVSPWRAGWLVVSARGATFHHFAHLRPRSVPLPAVQGGVVRAAAWAHSLELSTEAGEVTLFLLRDGPPPERLLSELLRSYELSVA